MQNKNLKKIENKNENFCKKKKIKNKKKKKFQMKMFKWLVSCPEKKE